MEIGDLDRKIKIQKRSVTSNDYNEETETWEDYKYKWAAYRAVKGGETYESDRKMSIYQDVFTIRFDSDITEAMRIIWDDKTYEIISIKPIGRKRWQIIEAEEKH